MRSAAPLHRADIWRARAGSSPVFTHTIPTGHSSLDHWLSGGGWPGSSLIELLTAQCGIGEMRLFLPALAWLSRKRWLACIDPPHIPYAPALACAGIDLARLLCIRGGNARESAWAMEQTLCSESCGAALAWLPHPDMRTLRRLQLAAEKGKSTAILFRPVAAANEPSPAALRLRMESCAGSIRLHAIKCRGGWIAKPLELGRW